MANNFFNPFPQQQNFMQQMPQNAPSSNITVQLVQGENGARLYPVAPNVTALLFDFNAGKFWIKATGANGFPSQFTAYNFVEEKPPEQTQGNNFVSQTEFDEVKNQLQQISAGLQTLLSGVNNNAIQQSANVPSEVQRICDTISKQRQESSANGSTTAERRQDVAGTV